MTIEPTTPTRPTSAHRGQAGHGMGAPLAANRELEQEQRKDDHAEAEQIEDEESAAPVGPDLVGELPNAAQADRRAHGGAYEAGAALPAVRGHRRATSCQR